MKVFEMLSKFIAPLLIVVATAACIPVTSAPAGTIASQSTAVIGSYAGVLPCADCSGIETKLTLNADGTYAITETYQGKGEPFVTKGSYSLDKSGTVVTLIDQSEHRSYRVGKNTLTALALDGSEITGDMAAMNVLAKVK
jgi:uncharacterized lipoprotein NlpE involved in copper resistance